MESLPGAQLLVVDDEPILLQLMTRVLRKAGYRVVTACDGDDAVRAFEKCVDPVEGVVIDLLLRPQGGSAALRAMLELQPDLGVVITSGSSMDPEARQLLHGCRGSFVRKPFPPDALLVAVREALGDANEVASGHA